MGEGEERSCAVNDSTRTRKHFLGVAAVERFYLWASQNATLSSNSTSS